MFFIYRLAKSTICPITNFEISPETITTPGRLILSILSGLFTQAVSLSLRFFVSSSVCLILSPLSLSASFFIIRRLSLVAKLFSTCSCCVPLSKFLFLYLLLCVILSLLFLLQHPHSILCTVHVASTFEL